MSEMEVRTVYLAGPMSGYKDFNREAFAEASEQLRRAGYVVINPAELDTPEELVLLDPHDPNFAGSPKWAEFLARDLGHVCDHRTEAVVVLPEWHRSRGARLEVYVASELGKDVMTLSEALERAAFASAESSGA
jgi:hypothetical protein